jgi:hypothetical protein
VLLDDHQAWFLAEEDLIGGGLFDAGPAELIQDGQQFRAASAGLLAEAAELGDTGRLTFLARLLASGLVQQDGEQAAADGQADAFGLGSAGKGGAAIVVEEEGVGKQVVELSEALLEGGDLFAEMLELMLRVVSVKGAQELLGVAVESLAGEAEQAGALGDQPVWTVEDGMGIGDA